MNKIIPKIIAFLAEKKKLETKYPIAIITVMNVKYGTKNAKYSVCYMTKRVNNKLYKATNKKLNNKTAKNEENK